jgi:hypothetical protein
MKTYIISDTTYYPSRINRHEDSEKTGKSAQGKGREETLFEKIFAEKISSDEVAAIRNMLGDSKIEEIGKKLDGNFSVAGKLGAIPRGSFVDIKI